jgi:hypothetical protein
MAITLLVIASLLTLLPLLLVVGLRNERAVLRDWSLVLTPRGQRKLLAFEERLTDELALTDVPYERAREMHELGSTDDAIRLLVVGYDAFSQLAPDMARLLAAMSIFSRMVAAMAPMPPVPAHAFESRGLAGLARVGGVGHRFLVTTAERYRLRLFILRHGFSVSMRYLFRSTGRIAAGAAHAEQEWRQVDVLRHDFRTLSTESLESFRILLTSLSAQRRPSI